MMFVTITECVDCNGNGIIAAPYDPNEGNKVVEHHPCNGWGIKIRRFKNRPKRFSGRLVEEVVEGGQTHAIPCV